MTSPFTLREEQPGVFRVYVYHAGLYPTGTRDDAERLLRSLEHERTRTNAAANAELDDLRALLARAVELFGGTPMASVGGDDPYREHGVAACGCSCRPCLATSDMHPACEHGCRLTRRDAVPGPRPSDAERVPWTGLAGHEKPCSWFTPGGNCECRERRQRTKEAPPEPPFPGTRASWAATAEAFRWVLERIAADSTDDDSRTLASAILNEPEYRTDEQKSALDAMRAKLHRTWSARPTLDVDRWKQWLWVRLDAVTTHDHIAEIAEELAFEVAPTPPIDIVCGRAIIEAALHWRERVRLGLTTATALEKIEQAIDATPKVHRSETALAERKAATISDLTWNSAIDECVAVIADLIEQGCIELSDRSWDKDTILSELRSLKTTPTGSEGP